MVNIIAIMTAAGALLMWRVVAEENRRLTKGIMREKKEKIDYKSNYYSARSDADYYEGKYTDLVRQYNGLVAEYRKLVNSNVDTKNPLIQKALKKAMMDAHPDHSGTQATAKEFMEYKKLYDESRGK